MFFDPTRAPRLNQRLLGLLHLVCRGLRNPETAQRLGISDRTGTGYVGQLFLIFDVTPRRELVGSRILARG